MNNKELAAVVVQSPQSTQNPASIKLSYLLWLQRVNTFVCHALGLCTNSDSLAFFIEITGSVCKLFSCLYLSMKWPWYLYQYSFVLECILWYDRRKKYHSVYPFILSCFIFIFSGNSIVLSWHCFDLDITVSSLADEIYVLQGTLLYQASFYLSSFYLIILIVYFNVWKTALFLLTPVAIRI